MNFVCKHLLLTYSLKNIVILRRYICGNTQRGWTALIRAAAGGHTKCVLLLLVTKIPEVSRVDIEAKNEVCDLTCGFWT